MLGFFTEQGPFRPNKDMTLSFNEYAWNQVSNMVFIEAPCGVGFSYSDVESDYTTGDAQTALDNYDMIQAFFGRFPEYSKNDMYISSESYGGHCKQFTFNKFLHFTLHLLSLSLYLSLFACL